MRPKGGPVKTGADVGGFGSGLATGLAVGLLALAALSVADPGRRVTGSAVDLPLPDGGTEPPRYWPGMSPEEQAARGQAASAPDADAGPPARGEPAVEAPTGPAVDPPSPGPGGALEGPVPGPAARVDDRPATRVEPGGPAGPAADGVGPGAAIEAPAPPSGSGLGATSTEAGPAVLAGVAPDGPLGEAVASGGPQVAADPASPLTAGPPPFEADGTEGSAPDPASAVEVGPAVPALLRHAARFEPPAEPRPYLSVVLLDDGSVPDAPARLGALPFPVSVALDLPIEAAAAREAAWRAAGFEVLAVATLPEGVPPEEVEVVLGAALDALPESVAVLDLGGRGPAAQTAASPMALARVARDGRGLVLAGGASSASLEAAASAGVPAARVLRELDATDQDEEAVRRILDDMARRAAQSGEAVVLGRLRDDTLAGLGDWAEAGRAGEVTVAPVSALLARMGDVQPER